MRTLHPLPSVPVLTARMTTRAALPLLAALALIAIPGCGGGGDEGTGEMSSTELLQMLPEAEQPQVVAADVDAAREAAGLAGDADPTDLDSGQSRNRFVVSTFVGLWNISFPNNNPVRDALDHSVISAYAAHLFQEPGAITLVATTQPFDDLAEGLEEAGYERDGDVVFSDGDPEELSYTAAAPGDGFLVLGYDPDTVRRVAAGEAEPASSPEVEAVLAHDDAPVVAAIAPEEPECIVTMTSTDQVEGGGTLYIRTAGKPDLDAFQRLDSPAFSSIGFGVGEPQIAGDEISIEIEVDPSGSGLVNPVVAVASTLLLAPDEIYDCG